MVLQVDVAAPRPPCGNRVDARWDGALSVAMQTCGRAIDEAVAASLLTDLDSRQSILDK